MSLAQRFFRSLAFADVAQDCLKISTAYRRDGDFHRNDLAILAHELSLEAQSAFSLQFFQSLLKEVAFFREIGVRDRRADQFVLWNPGELSSRAVSQNAGAIGVNDIDCVG